MKMLMSDYEVTLVNDNMQEFYVRFKGPEESKLCSYHQSINTCSPLTKHSYSTFPRRSLENPRRAPRPIPIQVAKHRLCQSHLPSQHRRAVRQRVSRRHQPDLVSDVRHGQHLRGLPAAAAAIPQSDGSAEWRGCGAVDEGSEGIRCEGQR
jgi:hypothetical protein